MTIYDAAQDISLTDYSAWGDAERIVINVATLYREFSGGTAPSPPLPELFGMMAQIRRAQHN